MKTTLEYLDDLKRKMEIKSDYEIAKTLGVSRSNISDARRGRNVLSKNICLKIGMILGVNAAEIITAANIERAKSTEEREAWEKISKSLGSAASFMGIGSITYALFQVYEASYQCILC